MPRHKRRSENFNTLSPRKIANILEELPLTQADVAQYLGVSQGLVSQWKNGQARITPENARALQRVAEDAEDAGDVRRDMLDDGRRHREDQEVSSSFKDWLVEQLDVLGMTQAALAELADVSPITISNLVTSKTENPQQDTRRRIVDALKAYSKGKGPRERKVPDAPEADPREPVVGVSFREEGIDQAPSELGVYVIHDKRGWPTYVGKGNIRTELKTYNDRKWAAPYTATKFSYALVEDEKDALRIETIIIKFMADSLLVNSKKRVSVAER